MNSRFIFIAFAVRALALPLEASVMDDLASPSQAVRDRAAKELRATYRPVPRKHWEPVIHSIKLDQERSEVERVLQPLNVLRDMGADDGNVYLVWYRLDPEWKIRALYDKTDDRLLELGLLRGINDVGVAPPNKFTGSWVVYFTNGVPSARTHYKHGQHFGVWAQYHPNGSLADIQHYSEKGCEGWETRYYPTGKASFRGRWSQGWPIGKWVYYDEDGTILYTERHSPAERNLILHLIPRP
jgi:hypothetical protein